MRVYSAPQKLYLLRKSTVFLLIPVAFVLLLFMTAALFQVDRKKEELDTEAVAMESEISGLKKNNEEMRTFISYLKSSEFLLMDAKSKFGMKLPGEEVIVITDKDLGGVISERGVNLEGERTKESKEEEGGIWSNPRRWLRYFSQPTVASR